MGVSPGKALRMLVESQSMPRDSTCILQAEPGQLLSSVNQPAFLMPYLDKAYKLDIQKYIPGVLFISLQVSTLFKLLIMT